MISRPANWAAIHGIRTQTLIAPEGAQAAGIRYTERVRPLMRLGDIVAEWMTRHADFGNPQVGQPERLLTREGEHAGLVIIDGDHGGKPAQASLGVVFGDDFYARIEGFALRPDVFESTREMVRELTISDYHVLGRRRRRYEYTAPNGWQPIVRGFTTDWVSPGFPLQWGLIVAYAASPIAPVDEVDFGMLATRAVDRGFTVDASAPPVEVSSQHGLVGVVTEVVGTQGDKRMLRAFVTMTDRQYLYSAELMARTEDAWPAHRQAFAEFWQSIVPIPGAQVTPTSVPFEFWAD